MNTGTKPKPKASFYREEKRLWEVCCPSTYGTTLLIHGIFINDIFWGRSAMPPQTPLTFLGCCPLEPPLQSAFEPPDRHSLLRSSCRSGGSKANCGYFLPSKILCIGRANQWFRGGFLNTLFAPVGRCCSGSKMSYLSSRN